MRPVLVKVYAAFAPAGDDCLERLKIAAGQASGDKPWLFAESGSLRVSFEGTCFPLEDCLEALSLCLPQEAAGKLDYLDMEAWTLTRCELAAGDIEETGVKRRFTTSTRSLNHVLAFSGH